MPFRRDPDRSYRVPNWDRYSWLEHGFGTRASRWPDPELCVSLKQIHSADILLAAGAPGCLGPGDAVLSRQAGPYLSVRTADCVPLLFVDPMQKAVAAIHAGWRGTVAEIGPKALARMMSEFGTKVEDLEVAIGPSIGVCCYEVGPEVASQFRRVFRERSDLSERTRLDLVEANRRQLTTAGVRQTAIYVAGLCTFCKRKEFHSHRRDAEAAGRMVSAIRLR